MCKCSVDPDCKHWSVCYSVGGGEIYNCAEYVAQGSLVNSLKEVWSFSEVYKRILSVSAVGDPVSDVGGASLLHHKATLVAILGDVVHLLHRHCFHHVPCHTQALGMHHTKVISHGWRKDRSYKKRRYRVPLNLYVLYSMNFYMPVS